MFEDEKKEEKDCFGTFGSQLFCAKCLRKILCKIGEKISEIKNESYKL